MAKKTYIGVNSVARKVKKFYIGIGGVAKKVKKVYIGVSGVARMIFGGSGEISYYGAVTPLSQYRRKLASASVGNYALFGGGTDGDYMSRGSTFSTVDAYNKSFTRATPMSLSSIKCELSATSVGNYALFGGGYNNNGSSSTVYDTVDAYDTSLTRTSATVLSRSSRCLASTSVGNYALFGGGTTNTVNAYDTSLTRTTPTSLSKGGQYLTATKVGNYALFGGGHSTEEDSSGLPYATVNAYDSSLTRTTPTTLSVARYNLASGSTGNYALFGGGYNSGTKNVVDAYDTSLTRTTPTALSTSRQALASASIGDFVLFGGGSAHYNEQSSTKYNTVDAYNDSLTRTTPTALSQARGYLTATTLENYALFGGGMASSTSPVDVYQVS